MGVNNLDNIDLKILAGVLLCLLCRDENVTGKFVPTNKALEFTIFKPGFTDVALSAALTQPGSTSFRNERAEVLQTLLDIQNDPSDPIFDTRVIFKAFLSLYLQNKADVVKFYKEYSALLSSFKIVVPECASDIRMEKPLLEVEELMAKFPYRPGSNPGYRPMPFFIGNKEFDPQITFSNCVESALYHVLNGALVS